jgi:hypothetical protein
MSASGDIKTCQMLTDKPHSGGANNHREIAGRMELAKQ